LNRSSSALVRRRVPWGLFLALCWLAAPTLADTAAPAAPDAPILSVQAFWSQPQAKAGEELVLSLVVRIAPGVHINADRGQLNPSQDFRPYPTQVEILEMAPPVVAGAPQFPRAHEIHVDFAPQNLSVFDGQVVITIPVAVPADTSAEVLSMRLALRYQGCDAVSCWMPGSVSLTTKLPIAP